MSEITASTIQSFQQRLEQHPVYAAVRTTDDLACFMQHHVYSVWDFMSLIKYLQNVVAPSRVPWTPTGDGSVRRFINELVLEEESDEALAPPGGAPAYESHFELYCHAMEEIGADPSAARQFVEQVRTAGIAAALDSPLVPEPSRQFTRVTFEFIDRDQPHVVAAALALGREHIIPGMFRSFLGELGVTETAAPAFHYYLKRHVHLDEDFHAPLSLRLLNGLCNGDATRQQEAVQAAERAVDARLRFWDGVLAAIGGGDRRAAEVGG